MAHGLPAAGFADCAGVNALIQPGRTGLAQLGLAAEAPEHAHRGHAVVARAVDVHVPVADHPGAVGRQLQPLQRLGDQLGLVAEPAAVGGADHVFEGVAERQVVDDLARVRLVLGGDHGETVARRGQRQHGLADAFVDVVLGPAVGFEAVAVMLHGRLGARGVAQQRAEAVAQRRADPAAQRRVVGHRLAQLLERMRDAAGDADGGVDQGAVEVEEQRRHVRRRGP